MQSLRAPRFDPTHQADALRAHLDQHGFAVVSSAVEGAAAMDEFKALFWDFLESMLIHIESPDSSTTETAPPLVDVSLVRHEIARMRSCFDTLQLPIWKMRKQAASSELKLLSRRP